MHVRLRALLPACLLIVATALTAAPAQAATTSTGTRCTLVGTSGADHLVGTSERDVICGLGGNDVIEGRGGDDLVDGGPGSDRLVGGRGADRLLGVGGNDDLDGGDGDDRLDGGAGTNWCTVGVGDTRRSCVYDREVPASDRGHWSTSTVDVTGADRVVTAALHVTDDTGVATVLVQGLDDDNTGTDRADAHLVSGTVRDGTWKVRITVRHWSEEKDYALSAYVQDRTGRIADVTLRGAVLHSVDRNPDTVQPRVGLRTPLPTTTYDVRSSAKDVTAKAHVTDALSGVDVVEICLDVPDEAHLYLWDCALASRVSGDRHDGVWRAVFHLRKGEPGGDWNVEVRPRDRAHGDNGMRTWTGPQSYREMTGNGAYPDPTVVQIPNGRGPFVVKGIRDNNPPHIGAVTVTPDHVGTLVDSATVTFRVHATDVEGVRYVGATLVPADPGGQDQRQVDLSLASGTHRDGTWTGTLNLPQGTAPGTYYVQTWVLDRTHSRIYASASSSLAQEDGVHAIASDPHVVVEDQT